MSDGRQDQDDASGSLSEWTATKNLGAAETPQPDLGFTPGTMLAGRYRVVALLGRGGMGEVYRADDTKLGQPVAIKFVRGALSPELRERLYAEVRIGRQISHPNVCRLYDIVEVEGQTFLAMEYVDGEDLASLLARIGRLAPDKALEIARDLCAGLAAVHEKGVAHRDLKPANVMIDGRGRARLTDFGLAIALEAPGTHAAAGTPSYMAPEQLAGGEVTLRSDLYAFGLIVYEMLSGRRLFDASSLEQLYAQHRDAKAPKLASVTRLVDSQVERAIAQCLDEEPGNRPVSARLVMASLPGGDPLEAALAAGETPTPEMVAAAGTVGDLTPLTAWAVLLVLVAGFVAQIALSDRSTLLRRVALPRPPVLLAERARDMLMRLGHADAVDSTYFFETDEAYLAYVAKTDRAANRWDKLRTARPGAVQFVYRQSPRELVAANRDAVVTRTDPPASLSGMAEVSLDPSGRLTSFLAVPPQLEPAAPAWPEPDWSSLFEEAGLEPDAFKPVAPEWAAPVDSDRKAAWLGAYAGQAEVPIRVEAAAYHGRVVWFEILPPWAHASRMQDPLAPFTPNTPVAEASVWLLAIAMPFGGVLLARRNLRLGRGDRKAAFRVALFAFASFSLARLFRADHASSLGEELWILIKVFAYPCFWGGQVWLLYMALEPYARRRWPRSLISWKRLVSGSFRDPSVGRDLLIGSAAGIVMSLLYRVSNQAPGWLGMPPPIPETWVHGATLASTGQVFFRLFVNQFSAVLYALAFLFLLVLLRVVLRNQYLAIALWLPLVSGTSPGDDPAVSWAVSAVRGLLMLFLLTRCGLLSLVVALYFGFGLIEAPISFDFSAWYAVRSVPMLAVLACVVGYGFHTALAGKPLFGRPLLDD